MTVQRVVIVNGFPGTGKTTLGRAISDHFGWPFISKDAFKEIMFDTIGWSDKEWSLKLSAATHRVMDHLIAEILSAGHSIVVESTPVPDSCASGWSSGTRRGSVSHGLSASGRRPWSTITSSTDAAAGY